MRQILVYNDSRPAVAPVSAHYCDHFLCQLRGLTFRRDLPGGEGLLLVQKSDSRVEAAIHMLGVLIDLAVIWIDSAGKVVDTRLALRWRPAYFPRRPARYVLEIGPQQMDDFRVGEQVRFEEL